MGRRSEHGRRTGRRASRRETLASLAVLAALAAVAVGVGVAQGRYDPAVYRALAAAAKGAAGAPGDGPEGAAATALAPGAAPSDLFGVSPDSSLRALAPLERYGPDDLHLKIDGKADLYLSAGFVELRCGRYGPAPPAGDGADRPEGGGAVGTLEVCVYDLAAPANAWSVWSRQRRDGAADAGLGANAYQTVDGLFLAEGRYYAEIVFRSGDLAAARDALGARFVAAWRPAAADEGPPGLRLLPPEGLVRDRVKLVTESAFGFDRFDQALVAPYAVGDETLTAFVSMRADAAEAGALRDAYVAFLLANGGSDLGEAGGARLVDLYGTFEAVFAVGSVTAGVHEAPSREAAVTLAARLRAHIAEATP